MESYMTGITFSECHANPGSNNITIIFLNAGVYAGGLRGMANDYNIGKSYLMRLNPYIFIPLHKIYVS